MRTYDFSPLFRSTVGFDRVSRLLDAALQGADSGQGYPPYNIAKVGEDQYRITMAVAGFTEADVELVQQENTLLVRGRRAESDDEGVSYLHRGIASRSFEHRFQLADHIQVSGASLENGLLDIQLVREVPEAKKPRVISVRRADADTSAQISHAA
ncbi:molecular chaperone IbpA [Constrictibacter sp. MBR-5]|jgi:molecular chaperone IbpA|uniref:Hsp20 family protein n=1 Tax=Constrictibacter sp. MBR-5 TaxID=3156467 RepID=UPI00339B749A